MRFFPVIFAIAALQVFVVVPVDNDESKAEELAQEMHVIASRCKEESLENMLKERSKLLTNNENETAAVFIAALEMKIDGYDIIAYLRSFNTEVCTQCAEKMIEDHKVGRTAIKWWLGGQTIGMAKQVGALKY